MEKRLTELESRVAFQDDTIQKLNDVVVAQQDQLDRMFEELKYLNEKIKVLDSELVAAEDQETPPPHY
jgi:SlyX protein